MGPKVTQMCFCRQYEPLDNTTVPMTYSRAMKNSLLVTAIRMYFNGNHVDTTNFIPYQMSKLGDFWLVLFDYLFWTLLCIIFM